MIAERCYGLAHDAGAMLDVQMDRSMLCQPTVEEQHVGFDDGGGVPVVIVTHQLDQPPWMVFDFVYCRRKDGPVAVCMS